MTMRMKIKIKNENKVMNKKKFLMSCKINI